MIKYLPYPKIPDNLLPTVEEIIAADAENIPVDKYFESFAYKTVSKDLDDWLRTILRFKFYAKFQVIKHTVPVHRDNPSFPGDRRYAINYLLQLGGDNVITTCYDDEMNITCQERLPLKTWHTIHVEKLHGISGIEEGNLRVALSVTPLLGT